MFNQIIDVTNPAVTVGINLCLSIMIYISSHHAIDIAPMNYISFHGVDGQFSIGDITLGESGMEFIITHSHRTQAMTHPGFGFSILKPSHRLPRSLWIPRVTIIGLS